MMSELYRYSYDPLDRLAGLTPLAQVMRRRFYSGQQLSTEVLAGEQRTFLRVGRMPLAQQILADGEPRVILNAADQQQSVLHAHGAEQRIAIAYAPYGHSDEVVKNPDLPGFNGEQIDPVTGHYLLGNGYRAYNPVLMRFNSPDSLSPFGKGGLNAYGYCAGDPVNRSDPTGHIFRARGLLLQRGSQHPQLISKAKGSGLRPSKGQTFSASRNTSSGDAFRKPEATFADMPPHIKEAIAGELSSRDAVSLALTSKDSASVVMTTSAHLFKKLNIRDLSSQSGLKKLDEIYFGEVTGIAPMFLRRNGILFSRVLATLIREPRLVVSVSRIWSGKWPVQYIGYQTPPETAESLLQAAQIHAMNGGGF